MRQADICIAGGGIIGLSLALELESRGASVIILERDAPLSHASHAAAGMLAAHDPENPVELLPLAELSLSLYPAFLARIESLSSQPVPLQTDLTYQSVSSLTSCPLPRALTPGPHTFARLREHSLDPRQLASALLAAVRATSIQILEQTHLRGASSTHRGVQLDTNAGVIQTGQVVYTLGSWTVRDANSPVVRPRKGQMLAVRIPASLSLDYVVRTPEIYVVPRTQGPRAGHAVLGATVEDAGFCTLTDSPSLAHLRALAARLLPALADEDSAPTIDQWAGLRPYTSDQVPILGAADYPNQFYATGHYRNGILLAPATAQVLAQTLAGESTTVDLSAFSASRDRESTPDRPTQPIFAHIT